MVKKYYEILEIEENATKSQIKKAYQKLALQYHPDKNPSGEAKFKEVATAYEVLGDEQKKSEYDKDGNFSLEKYGYDYGEVIEEGDMALKKYTDHIGEMTNA